MFLMRRLLSTAAKGSSGGLLPLNSGATGTTEATATVIRSSTAHQSGTLTVQKVQEKELMPGYVTSDVPEYMMTKRRARIFCPGRTAMQSGDNETRYWQIDFDPEDKWENKLMGWTSSSDAVQALRLRFHSSEQAIKFAEKQGWDYIVQEEQQPLLKAKAYGDNFKYSADKLRMIKTK